MRLTPCLAVVAIATGCASAPGSSAAPEPVSTATSGALTVDWTIVGGADPNSCASTAAAAIEVTVLDRSDKTVGSFQQSCSAFSTSITLDAGLYSARARLLDAAGVPRTELLRIDSITLYANSQFTAPIDFPKSAFF
jgi:predicted component of type VI protein secretion system